MMIRINLLPHRQEKREAQQRQFNMMVGLTAISSAACIFLASNFINHQIESQQARNVRLDQEIANLDKEIADIKDLKTQIKLMIARKQVVENLQTNRNQSVVMLDELSRQLPDGMFYKSIKQEGKKITLEGVADTNARVATMVHNLNDSQWLTSPVLIEIKAVEADQKKQNLFTLNVNIKPQNLNFGEQIAQQVLVH
jgi:type IV pilus assembly protein PilN